MVKIIIMMAYSLLSMSMNVRAAAAAEGLSEFAPSVEVAAGSALFQKALLSGDEDTNTRDSLIQKKLKELRRTTNPDDVHRFYKARCTTKGLIPLDYEGLLEEIKAVCAAHGLHFGVDGRLRTIEVPSHRFLGNPVIYQMTAPLQKQSPQIPGRV